MSDILDIGHKYRVTILVLIIVFALIVIGVIAISKYNPTKKEDVAIVLTEGDLAINFINGNEINIKDKKEHTYNITLINNSDKVLFYSLNITDIVAKKTVTAKLYDESNKLVESTDDVINDNEILSLSYINPNETIRYRLVLKSKKSNNFQGKLNVKNESEFTQTFGDIILLNNNISSPKTIPGKELATTDEGLVTTNDNDGISYYFRGNVQNNYVKIGELLFRIVRINGNGSVRLIYDNILNERYPYNTNLYDPNVGITSLTNITKSSVIDYLNKWYEDNIKIYDAFINEDNYCIDKTFENVVGNIKYSSSYNRIYNNSEPSLICSGELIKSKVGLISIDEVAFAGATLDKNESFYLYNDKTTGDFLTLSTYFTNDSNELTMINILENGSIGKGILASTESNIKPVINISQSAKVKGKGTINNPYIIVG